MHRQPLPTGKRSVSSALCLFSLLLVCSVTMASESELIFGTSSPVTSNLVNRQCSDSLSRSSMIDEFAASLEAAAAVALDADPLTHDTLLSVTRELRVVDGGGEALCHALLASGALEVIRAESRFLQANGSGRGSFGSQCFGPEQYYSIAVIKSALDIVKAIAGGFCSAAGCDPVTGSCATACVAQLLVSLAGLALDLPLQIDDKCSNAEHYRQIAGIRGPILRRVQELNGDVESASTMAGTIGDTAASEPDLVTITETLANGFGGRRQGDTDGLLARLESLQQQIVDAAAVQAAGETDAIAIVVERALINGQALASLRLPGSAGGLIELVREVVSTRIVAFQAAGVDVSTALVQFRKGDNALNDESYGLAFERYRNAYAALGTSGSESPDSIKGEAR